MQIEKLKVILLKCLKKDRIAQKELYEAFYKYGLSICFRYVTDVETCRELLNDSFMKVFTKFEQYDQQYPFKSWFHKIVVNTCLNHNKKQLIEDQFVDLEEASQVGIEDELFSKYSAEEILKLIQNLPTSYRTVFNLYCIEGYDHKEISAMLGINEGTSHSHLAKARKKIQSVMYLI
jgi:RNA polymerase sigma-70 factor (ECF subfamily)